MEYRVIGYRASVRQLTGREFEPSLGINSALDMLASSVGRGVNISPSFAIIRDNSRNLASCHRDCRKTYRRHIGDIQATYTHGLPIAN